MMKTISIALVCALGLFSVGAAQAAVPALDMICGADIAVRAEAGGPVFIDDAEAELSAVNDNYAEAKSGDITVSIAINTDGTPNVSYTGKGGINGICNPVNADAAIAGTIAFFNADCPTDLSVHADEGGPVYVNGTEAVVTFFSPTYFEAKQGEATISVSTDDKGIADVSYSAAGGANGICTLK